MTGGFKLSDVKAPVTMQHSLDDSQVPFVTAEMTARLLPHCHFDIRKQGGHFSKELLSCFFETLLLDIKK